MRIIGLRVLRFSDREVFENIEGVIEKIGRTYDLENLPQPLFSKEGKFTENPVDPLFSASDYKRCSRRIE